MFGLVYPNQLQGRTIRILELLPGHPKEEICCRLIETSLDDAPPYQALSYVWGNTLNREPILCNGQRMEVTLNLAEALRRLRPSYMASDLSPDSIIQENSTSVQSDNTKLATAPAGPPSLIWADAICINQEDVTERNSQVRLMKEVYSTAVRIAVWLGPDLEGHARSAFAAIEMIAFFLSTYQNFAEDMGKKGIEWNNQGRGHFIFELCGAFLKSKSIEDPWPSLRTLFMLPYWHRIWCVQEVHLAQEQTLFFGAEELDGRSLSAFTDWYTRESYRRDRARIEPRAKQQIALEGSGISDAWTTFNYRKLNAKDLFLVCDDFRSLDATNLRDKVYGVLGMWRPQSANCHAIDVDYNKSVAEVYTDVVTQAICNRKDLFVLRLVDHDIHHNFEEDEGFPSWVPRWDRAGRAGISWLDKSPLSATAYQAEIPDQSLARSGILKLKGVLFDRVVSTTNVLGSGSKSFMSDAEFRKCFIQLWLEATGAASNPDFRHQVSVAELATTVTCGMIKVSDDIHDRDDKDSEAWLDMSSLDTDVGRDFLYNFQSFIDSETYPGNPRGFDTLLACYDRRIFRTSRGYLGLGRRSMREGDLVTVLHGGSAPFVLRLLGSPGAAYLVLVGDCFVHDIMNKQIYDMLDEEGIITGEFQVR